MGKKSRRTKPKKERMPFVARTFEGLPSEGDWIALREFVPAASATMTLAKDDRTVRVCSLLPGGGAGIVRADGEIWLGLQVLHNYGDVSRDLAHVLETALSTDPGNPIKMTDPGIGPRLQDIVAPDSEFKVEVHDGFDFWVDNAEGDAAAALAQANESVAPTTKISTVESAYVSTVGERTYLRWVLPEPESSVLDGLSRLHSSGEDNAGDHTRLLGIFRAHGVLVPVWELFDIAPDDVADPLAELSKRLHAAMTTAEPLTAQERSARLGLVNRQVTIR